MAEERFEARLA
jgi:Xaa-Pro aminopeptidase